MVRKIIYLTLVCTFVSCASNSGVVSGGGDIFIVSRQAATGFSGSGTLKADAIQEATEFCNNKGEEIQIVSTQEAEPPYILGNFPKAEVQFRCLDSEDLELRTPALKQQPGRVVEIRKDIDVKIDSDKSTDLYSELLKLDDLLKREIITQEEFDLQKAKILSN